MGAPLLAGRCNDSIPYPIRFSMHTGETGASPNMFRKRYPVAVE